MTHRTLSNLALAAMALPVILGACLCCARPQGAWVWAIAMFFLPASWLALTAASRSRGNTTVGAMLALSENPVEARNSLSFAVIGASLIVALPLGAGLADALRLIDPSLVHVIAVRGTNVVAGVYFVLRGDRLPKVLTPLSDPRYDPAIVDALRRRAGWAFVLAGFTYAALWLVLPAHLAAPIGMAVIVAGILAPSMIMRSRAKRRNAPLPH